MEGILFDIKHFAVHDGPGIRTTLFFKGCPLSCTWCHNPEGISFKPELANKLVLLNGKTITDKELIGQTYNVSTLIKLLKKDELFFEESGGGITFSGGEPMSQFEFLKDVLVQCKQNGWHTCLDTSGQSTWLKFDQILEFVDLFLFDLKHLDSDKHQAFTGVDNHEIRKNLEQLSKAKKRIWIRIPVIPGFNDDERAISMMGDFLCTLGSAVEQVNLLPFHAIANHKYKRFKINYDYANTPSLHKKDLIKFQQLLLNKGLSTIIGG